MPLMETVTIINKSGKVVSTGKHLINIFKEAKDAYNDKKAEMKADHTQRVRQNSAQKLFNAREETRSRASSRQSHQSRSSDKDKSVVSRRPPLTEQNLSQISEGSTVSTRRGGSHHGSRTTRRGTVHHTYRAPYFENADISRPDLTRRHTDSVPSSNVVSRRSQPPKHVSHRSISNPDLRENIDMNLAYGELPPRLPSQDPQNIEREQELKVTMSKLDALLMEAHCLQHSAVAIISNLQANPEAMAAVALTLAELSNILRKVSPSLITVLKASSPAVFALLASPQFLIAGGLAIGVTVVMFGGYKIIKRIQEREKEANRMDEALECQSDLSSIENWRRGIAEAEMMSVATSVDGEFITPEAARQKKARIRERAMEERRDGESVKSERMVRKVRSESTIKMKDIPVRSSSKILHSESVGRSERPKAEDKGKETALKDKKSKKGSALSILFKKSEKSKDKGKQKDTERSHRPNFIGM